MVEWVPFTDPPPRRRPTDLNLRRRILDLAESPRRSGERQAGPLPSARAAQAPCRCCRCSACSSVCRQGAVLSRAPQAEADATWDIWGQRSGWIQRHYAAANAPPVQKSSLSCF